MESEFWKIIEAAGSPVTKDPDDQCEAISDQLRGQPKEYLVSFANEHHRVLANLDNWKILKASYVVLGYASDDVFEDFRNWIILHGKARYLETLENPEALADYAQVDDPVEEISGEPLLYVCENAWDGDIEELEEDYEKMPMSEYEMEWPSKEELASEFPKLVKRFNFGGEGAV
jgi:hypothetical protein